MSGENTPQAEPEKHDNSQGQDPKEVPFDPEAKPAKGILVKPGHKRDKKPVGGVRVADDGPESGQRKKYDMQKVEGREGIMVRKKSVGALIRPKNFTVEQVKGHEVDSSNDSENEDNKKEEEDTPKKKTDKKKK